MTAATGGCECGGYCVACRKARRVENWRRNAAERARQKALRERWPDLGQELKRLGYVMACNGMFHQSARSRAALEKGRAAGAGGY